MAGRQQPRQFFGRSREQLPGDVGHVAPLEAGDFELVLWDGRPASATHGLQTRTVCGISNPLAVVIPPGVVHAYRNISDTVGWVFNAPNRLYAGEGKREPVDEIRHEADPQSPFQLGQHLGERPAA